MVSNKILDNQIENLINSNFGSYAIPEKIFYLNQIPKTRSGKILRRLMREIVINPSLENYGDISTILNFKSIKEIQNKIRSYGKFKNK